MSRVYTSEDIPELEKEMEDFERRSAEIMEEYGRNEKSHVNDGAGKRARGLALAIDFLKQGVTFTWFNEGVITINNYFHVTLNQKKWRCRGKNTWYRYSTPEQFVRRYINKEGQ